VLDFSGKKILVTGGAGFIGSHIVDDLLAHGADRIVVVDNLVRGRVANLAGALNTRRVEFVQGDITDRELMNRLIAGSDIVFHQAALRITHCAAEPDAALATMVVATFDIVRACLEHKVRKLVYASTASVYGMAEVFPTAESHHPYDNRTLYGAAKLFGEGLMRSFNDMHGLDYVAFRYFNVYGPRMDLHGRYTEVLVRWMERIERGEPPIVFGDGLTSMDMVHVRDVARANILAAGSTVSDRVYNVGRGEETTLLDLAKALARAMGQPALTPVHEPARAVNPVPRRLADVSAAKRDLGFEAKIGLDEGIRELVDWWRAERQAELAEKVAS
jgi:UDP-glucose 4-epimerase